MSVSLFKLAPPGKRDGISCDDNGAFIGDVALLKRTNTNGVANWAPRDSAAISRDLGRCFGLPIDVSSKSSAIAAIANALNAGAVARAQLLTLFLRFPDPSSVAKSNASRGDIFEFVEDLIDGEFVSVGRGAKKSLPVKSDRPGRELARRSQKTLAKYNPNHWPAGAPDNQGGRFAPSANGDMSFPIQESRSSGRTTTSAGKPGAIQIAANGQICREVAVAGCFAASSAAAAEGAGAGCVVTGPGCPVGATVGGSVTALGACMIGGAEAYAACHSISSDRGFREALARCREECQNLYDKGKFPGPRGIGGSDVPGHIRRCIRECLMAQGYNDF